MPCPGPLPSSDLFARVLSSHVSAPNVIAGSTHELRLQACSNGTLFCTWCCISVPGRCSFHVLDLSVVDIYWCVVFVALSSTCSSSDPDCHFRQLILVVFVVSHVDVVGEVKMTKIFTVYLQVSGFPSQSSEYTFECCRKQFGRYGISLSYSSPDVGLVAFFV